MTKKIIPIGKQTYVFCGSRLTYLVILPHIFDIPLMVAINERLLTYPQLYKRAEKHFPNLKQIIEKQVFYSCIFEQSEINLFASVYPIRGKKQAMTEMQKQYRKIRKINYKQFPKIKILDIDIRRLHYFLIENTILKDYIPSTEDKNVATIKFMYLFPTLYDLQEKSLIEADAEKIEKKIKDEKEKEEEEEEEDENI